MSRVRLGPVYDQVYSRVLLRAHQKIVALTLEEGDRLLEIGVGTGLLLPQYPEHFRVTGIDISEPMLSRAAEKVLAHRLANIELRVGDAQRLSFKLATFDVVVLPFVITLLPNPEAALDECARVLKPGGSIIIASKISDGAGIQGLLEKAIAPFVEERPTLTRLRKRIVADCRAEYLPPPSMRRLKDYLATLDVEAMTRRREGKARADAQFLTLPGEFSAQRPLQVVQIDHTKVDVTVVDPIERQPIGRPILTIAIDVCTRTVLGFYLSLEAPSVTSVALCLTHSIIDKTRWLADRGISLEWPANGLPECIHVDNRAEFRARAFKRGCDDHNIVVSYPHLDTAVEAHAGLPDRERVEHMRVDRWVDYPRARQALDKLEELLLFLSAPACQTC